MLFTDALVAAILFGLPLAGRSPSLKDTTVILYIESRTRSQFLFFFPEFRGVRFTLHAASIPECSRYLQPVFNELQV